MQVIEKEQSQQQTDPDPSAIVIELLRVLAGELSHRADIDAARTTTQAINKAIEPGVSINRLTPKVPSHLKEDFDQVFAHIPEELSGVSSALAAAKPFLPWKADDSSGEGYYEGGADVGRSYSEGNMCCPLIGPKNSLIHSDAFLMVLFFLKLRTLYRDHVHAASEIYFNLTGPHGFRLAGKDWAQYPAGSVIWNKPWGEHATRVSSTPFLAAVSWLTDIDCAIKVTPKDDWAELEKELQRC